MNTFQHWMNYIHNWHFSCFVHHLSFYFHWAFIFVSELIYHVGLCLSSSTILDFFSPHRAFPSSWIHSSINFLFLSLPTMLDFVFPEIVHHIGFIFTLSSWSLLGVSFSLKLSSVLELFIYFFHLLFYWVYPPCWITIMFLLCLLAILDLFFHPPSWS